MLAGLSVLALISTVFGMMLAVARELPRLESRNEYKAAKNSVIYDAHGRKIAELTGSNRRILVESSEIAPAMKHAIVAIEDRRFYEHSGVDYRSIARALAADLRQQKAAQGGSTITQQFVKNALHAQSKRTIFQKLREASLAYNLERNWSKDKIMTQYLNAAYYGRGAHGVYAAARTYFGKTANSLTAPEAALLAGIVSSPSRYDPIQFPARSKSRRDLVLRKMKELRLLEEADYKASVRAALPSESAVRVPREKSEAPYFTDFIKQHLIDLYGAGTAFGGGLKVRTSLDINMQRRAEEAVQKNLAGLGPSATLVAINNRDGAVRAMVGGFDFDKEPFNLATNARRQPGSAFKPFTYITALMNGLTPSSTFISRPLTLPGGGKVKNYDDSYVGPTTLANGLIISDNSVLLQAGLKVGTRKVARTAKLMGIETSLSTNTAMILGGLKQGVTTFQMAHAFTTIARSGKRVSGTLAARKDGPVSILEVKDGQGNVLDKNKTRAEQVLPASVVDQTRATMEGVVSYGTGKRAAVGGETIAGKTGTTDNHADAWFCGISERLTVCIWVGYPKRTKPMLTEAGGSEVAGGTIPAGIFSSFMTAVLSDLERAGANREGKSDDQAPLDLPDAPYSEPETTTNEGKADNNKSRNDDAGGGKQKPSQGGKEAGPAPSTEEPQPSQPEQPQPDQPKPGQSEAGGTSPNQ